MVRMGKTLGGGPQEGMGEVVPVQRIGVGMGDRLLEGGSRQAAGVGVMVGEMGGDKKAEQRGIAGAEWRVQKVGKTAGGCEGGLAAMDQAEEGMGHTRAPCMGGCQAVTRGDHPQGT